MLLVGYDEGKTDVGHAIGVLSIYQAAYQIFVQLHSKVSSTDEHAIPPPRKFYFFADECIQQQVNMGTMEIRSYGSTDWQD